jgi:hypothetical protein
VDPVTFLLVAAVAGLTAFAIRADRQRADERDERWANAARLVSGEYQGPGKSWLRVERYTIGAEIGRAQVIVNGYGGKQATTAARSAISSSWDLDLRVVSEDLFASFGKTIGLVRDVTVGDRTFDQAYVVSSNDAALARAWLAPKIRAMIERREILRDWSISITGGQIEVKREGLADAAQEIVGVMRLAAALADRAIELHEAWSSLAEHIGGVLGGERDGPFVPIQVTERTVPIEVALVRRGRTSSTRIRALSTLKTDGAPPSCDLEGLVTDAERVREAVEEVATRAGATTGGYR